MVSGGSEGEGKRGREADSVEEERWIEIEGRRKGNGVEEGKWRGEGER